MRPLLASLLLCACQPALAEDVASVMLAGDHARIVHADGASEAADVGDLLDRTDTIVTGAGAVILHLRNERLVRVDEDLELAVADIVLLDAPPVALNARASLATLLYPDERDTLAHLDEAERVAGWHARLRAGVAPPSSMSIDAGDGAAPGAFAPPEPAGRMGRERTVELDEAEEIALPAPAAKRKADKGAPAPKPAPPRAQTAPAPAAPAPAASAPADAAPAGAEGSATGAAEESRSSETTPVLLAEAPAGPALPVDALRRGLQEAGDLHTCLVRWAGELPVKVREVSVVLRLADGRIRRVVLDHGLAAPPCARGALIDLRVATDAPSLSFDVDVSPR